MHPLLYIFPCSALFLEGLLLWRLSKHGLASRYPHLTVFVLFRFLGDLILFPINRYKPDWFAVAYWRLEPIAPSLQFLVFWDLSRGVFPRRSALHDIAWNLLLTADLGILHAVLLL